ncbi:type I restriction enzyme, S subunit [Lachnospiraceae bacterium XBB1006]|nr:type I restriction enzyme, S subunit [Lachnospiraceae bacterium XBB1006]
MRTLGEIFEIGSGGTPSKTHPEYYDGNIPWVKTGDLKDEYLYSVEDCISEEGLNNSSAKMYPSGTVLIAMYGATIGATSILKFDACTNQACAAFKPCEEVLPEYLYYFLRSKKQKFISDGVGGAQPNISAGYLKKVSIDIRNIKEQEKIVTVLDKLNGIIQKRQNEVDELDDLIKARFVELFGDARENPNKYDIVPFIDIVQYMGDIGSNGANKVVVDHLDMKDEEDYAMMVRFTNFTKNDFTDDVKYVSKEAYDFFKKSQIFGGELIICKIGSAGQNYVMPYLNRPVSLGLNQIMVRIKGNILMSYLYQYLHTDYGEFLISGCINGAVTKTITKTELKKIPVILPPMELQKEFESFVQQVDKSKVAVKKALDETQLLFDSLMQEYFG